MLFSIIVPVYNSRQYLEACAQSVISQSFADWELLFIDDGSKDGSGELADAYAQKYHGIRACHQENAGQFFARKKGIEMARGEYLLFLDSDDELKPGCLEVLSSELESKRRDIILYTGEAISEDAKASGKIIGNIAADAKEISPEWLKQSLISGDTLNSMCLKAFKRSLFDADNTDYSAFKGVCCGEDKAMLLYPLTAAGDIKYIPDCLYKYKRHAGSTSRSLEIKYADRLLEGEMFSILESFMVSWQMTDKKSRERLAVYYIKHSLSVYYRLKKQCTAVSEQKTFRAYPWRKQLKRKIFGREAIKYCLGFSLSVKDKIKLAAAAVGL